jgi:hypothetical protein
MGRKDELTYGVFDFVWLRKPGAETDLWDGGTCVQLDNFFEGHYLGGNGE